MVSSNNIKLKIYFYKGLFLGLSFLSFIEFVEIAMKVMLIRFDRYYLNRKKTPKNNHAK